MEKNLIGERFNLISWSLDERLRRIVCAAEAKVLGYGGVTTVSRATGVSRRAIHSGLKELEAHPAEQEASALRVRRPGGADERKWPTGTPRFWPILSRWLSR